jgi:3'-phosphoadenosine 5'-phosphosulfate sulfotransferase (PAPS reductase)/FAD synthetase
MAEPTHLVCFSGGHSSALVAIEVARRFGTGRFTLLNHDINPSVEDADIKRFKREVSDHIGVAVTYANYPHWRERDQIDIALHHSAFKADNYPLCTSRLKTEPFRRYLRDRHPEGDCIVYYGFDKGETVRIQRRSSIMAAQGYKTDYPLALWTKRTIWSTREVGIEPPLTYGRFKHANCVGCLRAGRQHWYVVFCERPDVWEKAKRAEDEIGYSIIKGVSLAELEPLFRRMRCAGIEPTEHVPAATFWARVHREVGEAAREDDLKPCECAA